MTSLVKQLWGDAGGQDLAEYTLLIAMIALLVGATFPALAALLPAQLLEGMKCVNHPGTGNCR